MLLFILHLARLARGGHRHPSGCFALPSVYVAVFFFYGRAQDFRLKGWVGAGGRKPERVTGRCKVYTYVLLSKLGSMVMCQA